MAPKEIRKRMMELTIGFVGDASAVANPDVLSRFARDLQDILAQAAAEGVDLPEEIFEQMAILEQIEGFGATMSQLMLEQDNEGLEKLSNEASALSGFGPGAYEPEPEIFEAIEDGDVAAVQACLASWDVNAMHGSYNETALYKAVSPMGVKPAFDVMHVLLDAGADPRIGLGPHSNVLHGFAFGYYKDDTVDALERVIRRCVALGADIEQRTENLNWTPLHSALGENNEPVLEALLRNGANSNARIKADANGYTRGKSALTIAMARPRMFELLLRYGADAEAVDPWGRTVRQIIQAELKEATDMAWHNDLRSCLDLLDE